MKGKLPDLKNLNIKSSPNKAKNKTETMTRQGKDDSVLIVLATVIILGIFIAALSNKPVENDFLISFAAQISMCIKATCLIVGYIFSILHFGKEIREIIKTTVAILILVSIGIGVVILVNYTLSMDWSSLNKLLSHMF